MRVTIFLTILFLLFAVLCSSEGDFGPECQYSGDMCDVDPENCIRKMREQMVLVGPCFGLYYGSGMLFDTRGDTPFWINVDERERWSYPKELTYSIYSKKASKTDWSVPGSVSVIPDCCSLTLNDSCILPKREPGEMQYVFMPLNPKWDDSWYCQYALEEATGKMEPCKDDDDFGCLEFYLGIPRKRKAFIPLSGEILTVMVDYCFFQPPSELAHAFANADDAEPIFDFVGNSSGNFKDVDNGEYTSCDLVENVIGQDVRELAADYRTQDNEVVCFFVRCKEVSNKWITEPACVRRSHLFSPGRREVISVKRQAR